MLTLFIGLCIKWHTTHKHCERNNKMLRFFVVFEQLSSFLRLGMDILLLQECLHCFLVPDRIVWRSIKKHKYYKREMRMYVIECNLQCNSMCDCREEGIVECMQCKWAAVGGGGVSLFLLSSQIDTGGVFGRWKWCIHHFLYQFTHPLE